MANERGFTLVETLASLILLSVILISVFGFFTNTFRFNLNNDENIQAMNLVRKHEASISTIIIEDETSFVPIGFEDSTNPDFFTKKTTEVIKNDEYEVTTSIKKEPEKLPENDLNGFYKPLRLVYIEVKKDGKLLSETYTYHEGTW